jgi:hypothetical protein
MPPSRRRSCSMIHFPDHGRLASCFLRVRLSAELCVRTGRAGGYSRKVQQPVRTTLDWLAQQRTATCADARLGMACLLMAYLGEDRQQVTPLLRERLHCGPPPSASTATSRHPHEVGRTASQELKRPAARARFTRRPGSRPPNPADPDPLFAGADCPIASQGERPGPSPIRASTSSSQASGDSPKPAACSHAPESACSDPRLWPAVPRQPDTPMVWPSIASMPEIRPSGTFASSLVRGTGGPCSHPGRSGTSFAAMPSSQRAVRSPMRAADEPPRPGRCLRRGGAENLLRHERPLRKQARPRVAGAAE